eukprot:TRINITY_DN33096_c0_g1_i2.p2 TRINITY_DN33096_c0_g1~~TRINITY_DN33096_c0_g1_i2.p2  ORF type:complete len:112 (-),score=11.41 TRINITY_DN33096_c0_g1_i2:297-632(-)
MDHIIKDVIDGLGLYCYPNGDIYNGEFKQGQKHGSGQYYYKAEISWLIGIWKEGTFQNGKWLFGEGNMYEGEFGKQGPKGMGRFVFGDSGLQQAGCFDEHNIWKGEEPLQT